MFIFKSVLLITTALAVIEICICGKTSNYINFGTFRCPRETKALGKCLRDNLNNYIPRLAKGVPEYKIPSCEPLLIPEVTFSQAHGPVNVKSQYKDIAVRGPSAMKIREINIDAPNKKIIASLYIPDLKIKGRYMINGQILMLPIEGEGLCHGNYSKIDATATITLGRASRKVGSDSLTCENLDVKFNVDSADIELDNLFGGDMGMGATMNKFLNDNWKKVSAELQPAIETSLSNFLKPLADRAFSTLNADDILS